MGQEVYQPSSSLNASTNPKTLVQFRQVTLQVGSRCIFSPLFLPNGNKKSRNSQPGWVNPFLLLVVFFQKIKKIPD